MCRIKAHMKEETNEHTHKQAGTLYAAHTARAGLHSLHMTCTNHSWTHTKELTPRFGLCRGANPHKELLYTLDNMDYQPQIRIET
jgi:hypothetical protein